MIDICGGSGGGGNGGRSGGGQSVQEKYESGMKLLQSEIDKTNKAYDAATDRGDTAARKQLRALRRELENKQSELKRNTDNSKFKFSIPK